MLLQCRATRMHYASALHQMQRPLAACKEYCSQKYYKQLTSVSKDCHQGVLRYVPICCDVSTSME
jgi:hypothetical protein